MESSVTILDRNNVGFVNQLHVYIPLVPWLSALQVIGLGRQNVNRMLVLATHIISVKHVSHTLNSETKRYQFESLTRNLSTVSRLFRAYMDGGS